MNKPYWPTFDSALGVAAMAVSLVMVACGVDPELSFFCALVGLALVGYDLGIAISERRGDI